MIQRSLNWPPNIFNDKGDSQILYSLRVENIFDFMILPYMPHLILSCLTHSSPNFLTVL